jgi:hypothetical protein
MIDPKLQRMINKIKAREAGSKTWLERNRGWVACAFAFAFATGFMTGRLW